MTQALKVLGPHQTNNRARDAKHQAANQPTPNHPTYDLASATTDKMNILDLPIDIWLLIFPCLEARDFLALTSTCKALHKPEFIHDAQYWSALVRTTFRVPNQPVVQHNGQRWRKLYRRLLTESRLYTWGNNEKACLGHSFEVPAARRGHMHRRRHISWPAEMEGTEGLGLVSDLQCGGWSTTLLTAKGQLYTVGVLDGLQFTPGRQPYMQQPMLRPTPLQYPSGYVQPHERHDPTTAIKQFSSGRSHVLALSDSGRIWTWQNIAQAGLHVKFLHHETREGQATGVGTVHKVVGGWNKSAALVEGTGIVLWEPLDRENDDVGDQDGALVLETAFVPKTNYLRTKWSPTGDPSSADTVGEVLNFVVLEHIVLFNTSLGKVFAAQIHWSRDIQRIDEPIELDLTGSEQEEPKFATDVQGSFRSFAVFTRDGQVLTSTMDRVMDAIIAQRQQPQEPLFKRIPALQHKDVISVAFGDYHFHALHSSGYITSYGTEPQACGALGLGGHGDPEGRLRGIRYQGIGGDGRLVPHAYAEGRRVWFEEEKRDWISFITAGGVDPAEAAERIRMALGQPDVRCQGEVSEWIEQQGRDWESKFGLRDEDDDGLGAYFALSVTAAGWHSGALVLVNERLAGKIKAACEIRDPDLPPDEEDEEEEGEPVPTEPTPNTSLVSWAVTTALDYGRWFLGIYPYNVPVAVHSQSQNATNGQVDGMRVRTEQIHAPRNFGESPREGYKYVWANDHFPRLRLSNGVEMPGSVPFDEWRYGRPEYDLDAGP
jgi:SCF-associated factor 1